MPVVLAGAAVLAWWWTARMSNDMGDMDAMGSMGGSSSMSFAGFMVAWVAMMAAMMLPAITPVVKLYSLAATRGRVAPLPFFVAGYLAVWTVVGAPAYFAWRALEMPLANGDAWAARLAGSAFIVAAAWQLSPIKSLCLRHCRSPLSFFMRFGGSIGRPFGALRMGAAHGTFCLGCCWMLFVVLVALGTMSLTWMILLTALIVFERNIRGGEQLARIASVAFAGIGIALVVSPSLLVHMT